MPPERRSPGHEGPDPDQIVAPSDKTEDATTSRPDAMMRALLDAHGGDVAKATVDWQKVKADAASLLDAEIQAAKNWQPKVTVKPLTLAERRKLDGLLADRFKDKPTIGAVRRRRDTATKSPAYAAAAFEGEARTVASAAMGIRNVVLNTAAFNLGQLVGGELLERNDVETGLLCAAIDAGLDEPEARATIRSGLDAGIAQPRRTR